MDIFPRGIWGHNMSVKPSYCHDCRKSNTYQRILAMDMKTESGAIFEEYWKCQTPFCPGHVYYPATKIASDNEITVIKKNQS